MLNKSSLLLLLILLFTGNVKSQTLNVGDIAIIGVHSDTPDQFVWIALNDIPAGEIIYFTDMGWDANSNSWFNNSEGHVTWTSPAGGIACGTIIHIEYNGGAFFTTGGGSAAIADGSWSLLGGDQVLAYRGGSGHEPAAPFFLHAVNCDYDVTDYNATTTWSDGNSTTSSFPSMLPLGMTNGTDCISIYPAPGLEYDNNRYTGSLTGTPSAVFASINNASNWTAQNDVTIAMDASQFSTPNFTCASTPGIVLDEQKISDTQGNFLETFSGNDHFGNSVAGIGDLNNDGIQDMVVGANNNGTGGCVYILFMNSNGTVNTSQKIATGIGGMVGTISSGDDFGYTVASIGDLDNDGVNDIAVGAEEDSNKGAVWILFMNTDGTVKAEQKITEGVGGFSGAIGSNNRFSYGLAGIGDLDNDGNEDIAVGALMDDDGGTGRGAVWILFLNSDGTVDSHQKISDTQGNFLEPLQNADNLGSAVAGLGDLDGDGVEDIAVGAYLDDDGSSDAGAVYIMFLNTNGTVKSYQKISDTQGGFTGIIGSSEYFGNEGLANMGDINGDGIVDLAVGQNWDGDGGAGKGSVWTLFLNTNGTVSGYQKISETEGGFATTLDTYDLFGTGIANIGDLDGDGRTDMAVGAPYDDDGSSGNGAVYVLNLGGMIQACTDTDGDGTCDDADSDDDNDGVADIADSAPTNPSICQDMDGDGCDDCSMNPTTAASPTPWAGYSPSTSNDGTDTDGDGICDTGDNCPTPNPSQTDTDGDGLGDACDSDDDNDGVADISDSAPLDPTICQDADSDGCDDCSVGTDGFGPLPDNDTSNDGLDTDGDGMCNTMDTDDDNDGVADGSDISPLNPSFCGDSDMDGCDDCSMNPTTSGSPTPWASYSPDTANDGLDTDGDGICDLSDPDDDNDGVADISDSQPLNPYACQDLDGDGCDDCSIGTDGYGPLADFDTNNDGTDTDMDGACDFGDPCPLDSPNDTDGDGVCDSNDPCPLNNPDDSDNDGVCDITDQCPGFDDNIDTDMDGTPDGCDVCPDDAGNDFDGDGYCSSEGDCDDNDANVNPGETEILCNGIDDDCDPLTLDDPIAPTASNPATMNVQCASGVPAADILVVTDAADNCSTPTVTWTGDVSDGGSCPETITRTYHIEDAAGNSIDVTQTIVVSDNTMPTGSNPATINIECIGDVPAPDITVVTDEADNCTVTPVVTWVDDVTDGLSCPETITRRYRITDDCGNFIDVTQLIIVNDITGPLPDVANLSDINSECEVTPTAPTAMDNCDGATTATPDVSFPITTTQTITWTYTDVCGNTTQQTQEVIITPIDNGITQVDAVTLSADATGYTYQWVDCDNSNADVVGATNQTFTPTSGGNYACEIDNGTCTVTTPCLSSVAGIIESNFGSELIVYPNPTFGDLKIDLGKMYNTTLIKVYDALGKEILSKSYNSQDEINLHIKGEPGMYILDIKTDAGNNARINVIKE